MRTFTTGQHYKDILLHPLRGQEERLGFFYIYKLTQDLCLPCSGEITLLSATSLLSQEHNNSSESKSPTQNWFSSIVRHATAQPGTEHMALHYRLWTQGGATRASII